MIPFLNIKKINGLHERQLQDAIKRVVDSGWFVLGDELNCFESEYAKYIGTNYAVGVGNGLDAITIIFKAYIEMGILKEGDEVIIPANTFIASVIAVIRAGLSPVLADVNEDTLLMDVSNLEHLISSNTKAVLIVHLYGKCAYSAEIHQLCKSHGLILIEDNAQAHGCLYENRRTGSLADAAAHSFYPGKNLGAMGDAGAITTNDKDLAERVKHISNYGFKTKYFASVEGCNSRMDEMQAAVLRVKLKYLDEENNIRKHIAAIYNKEIDNHLIAIPDVNRKIDSVYHLYPILTPYREQLRQFLYDNGIETQIHYPVPPHKQQCFPQFNSISLPVTEKIANCELSLPISQVMTDYEINKILRAVNSFSI